MNKAPGIGRSQAFGRLFDGACSAVGLLFLIPVFAGVALVILLDDGPPVFFRQMRVGRNGKLFRIWKFRTMRSGSLGSVITSTGDGRVTKAGAKLRKYKLDELPQLVNVLKGDMSLVGPRPEVPEHVHFEAPMWQSVLEVRPGITDLASILYRDEENMLGVSNDPNALYVERILPAKLHLNLAYRLSRTFWRDLKLICLTIRCSIFPKTFDRDLVLKTFGNGAGNE